MYAGTPLRRSTPLTRSVEMCHDKIRDDGRRTIKQSRDFVDENFADLRRECNLTCVSLAIANKAAYQPAFQTMQAALDAGHMYRQPHFEQVITFMQPRSINEDRKQKMVPTQFHLSLIVKISSQAGARSALKQLGFTFDEVQAYKSSFHGTLSYGTRRNKRM